MVVHIDPRFYGSIASRYDKEPIFNLDLLMALYQYPPAQRDIYADDEGVLIVETVEEDGSKTALLDAKSADSARMLLECLEEDRYTFVVRERWLTMVVQTEWDVTFQDVEPKRYATGPKRFSGEPQHPVIEIQDKHAGLVSSFNEQRDDFHENPALEDLLSWKQKGRDTRIFAALEEGKIQSYLVTMPICAELDNVSLVTYVYTAPSLRKRGYAVSALSAATAALLNEGRLPVITPTNDRMKAACERLGFQVSDDRLRGTGTRSSAS